MEKGIRFNSNELFTILDINHPEGRYFFWPHIEILISNIDIFPTCLLLCKLKEKRIFFPSTWFGFTMGWFQRACSEFEFPPNIFFWGCPYLGMCTKFQHIEKLPFVDDKFLSIVTSKTWIWSGRGGLDSIQTNCSQF